MTQNILRGKPRSITRHRLAVLAARSRPTIIRELLAELSALADRVEYLEADAWHVREELARLHALVDPPLDDPPSVVGPVRLHLVGCEGEVRS